MNALYQYSHFSSLNSGQYDGTTTIGDLKSKGTTGIGTFHALEGELVVVDGIFFHCTEGIHVRKAQENETLPWAALADFSKTPSIASLKHLQDIHALEKAILSLMTSRNYPYLLRIEGTFENVVIGSVPKQQKPYATIAEVIDSSITVETGQTQATLVGFYAPNFMFPMKSKGLHLHCVSKDNQYGGHVLDITLQHADIHFEPLIQIHIELPQHSSYQNARLPDDVAWEGPVFADKINGVNDAKTMEQLTLQLQSDYPYDRNNTQQHPIFEQTLPHIMTVLNYFKAHEPVIQTLQPQAKQALITLVRRASEYMLSSKRATDFAIHYNTLALQWINTHAIKDITREHITLLNHLGFAYYFPNEKQPSNTSMLAKASASLESAITLNANKAPDLMAYSHCILGQIALVKNAPKEAFQYFIQSYQFYRNKHVNADCALTTILDDLKTDIAHLNTPLPEIRRENMYQAMVVSAYIADAMTNTRTSDFPEQCYLLCIQFIQIYWQKDTLQSADIYHRLGKYFLQHSQQEKALTSFSTALQLYTQIPSICTL